MELPVQVDNPHEPEFASWSSFRAFSARVRRESRFVWGPEVRAFLDTVLATIQNRDVKISKGDILYRAQRGIECEEYEGRQSPSAFGPQRMKPLKNRAKEGRANPLGIPILYLASNEQTAICEVRPWIGSEISVAQAKIVRELKAINLSLGHAKSSLDQLTLDELLGEQRPSREKIQNAVWTDIDNAFSRPITLSDDEADYVPTQILAELFHNNGYEALIYRSQFGQSGYNVALFNISDTEIISAAPYQVTEIDVKFEEIGARWFAKKEYETTPLDSD